MASNIVSGTSKRSSARRPKLTADEKIFYALKKAPPLISEDVSQDIERFFINVEEGIPRRMALAVLAMPGGELIAKIEGTRAAAVSFAEIMEYVGDYVKRLRQITNVLDAAQLRLSVALCVRDDMSSVLAEGKDCSRANKKDEHRTNGVEGASHG